VLAENIPDAILWHEGMLLAPQHFQQFSLRQEALVQYNTTRFVPFAWGVHRLSIDQNLLLTGLFRVLELEAIMPDGLVVSHDGRNGSPLEIDLTSKKEEVARQTLAIHLAVPDRACGLSKEGLARYDTVEGDPVADEHSDAVQLQIPRLKPRLSLLAADVPASKYVSFPLARVQHRNEAFALTSFIPPMTEVPLQSPLGELCALTAKRLREKAMFLADQLQAPSATAGMPSVLETKSRIQCLVAGLPMFEAVLFTGQSHPFLLYLAFCSLAGNLAVLGNSLLPPLLPPYNHNDLRATFEQVQKFAFRMMTEGISEAYSGIPFHFENGIFSLNFDPGWAHRRLLLGMRGQTGMAERDLIEWAETCLIGSQTVIASLREKRILGAPREFIERDEELAVSRGTFLFLLRAEPASIKPGEILQILNREDSGRTFRPEEIVLYVKNAGS
jgi:type VI secretion system protein ImpJ